MRFYIATAFTNWKQAQSIAQQLEAAGHVSTATWLAVAQQLEGQCARVSDPEERKANARQDLEDIRSSNELILVTPAEGGCGCWLEVGYALGRSTSVSSIGPVDPRIRTIFGEIIHHYPTVHHFFAAEAKVEEKLLACHVHWAARRAAARDLDDPEAES